MLAVATKEFRQVRRDRALDGTGVLVTTHFMDEAHRCDRLLVMSKGRIVLRGTHDEVVGDRRIVQVDCGDWAGAFAALDAAGWTCGLVGTSIRVLETDGAGIGATLHEAGIDAALSSESATLEETMVAVARGV